MGTTNWTKLGALSSGVSGLGGWGLGGHDLVEQLEKKGMLWVSMCTGNALLSVPLVSCR